jgi:hypothetical protein
MVPNCQFFPLPGPQPMHRTARVSVSFSGAFQSSSDRQALPMQSSARLFHCARRRHQVVICRRCDRVIPTAASDARNRPGASRCGPLAGAIRAAEPDGSSLPRASAATAPAEKNCAPFIAAYFGVSSGRRPNGNVGSGAERDLFWTEMTHPSRD